MNDLRRFSSEQDFVTSGIRFVWENSTATSHTITHDGCREGGACAIDSGVFRLHETFEITGLPTDNIPTHCTLHPTIRGPGEVGSLSHLYPSDSRLR